MYHRKVAGTDMTSPSGDHSHQAISIPGTRPVDRGSQNLTPTRRMGRSFLAPANRSLYPRPFPADQATSDSFDVLRGPESPGEYSKGLIESPQSSLNRQEKHVKPYQPKFQDVSPSPPVFIDQREHSGYQAQDTDAEDVYDKGTTVLPMTSSNLHRSDDDGPASARFGMMNPMITTTSISAMAVYRTISRDNTGGEDHKKSENMAILGSKQIHGLKLRRKSLGAIYDEPSYSREHMLRDLFRDCNEWEKADEDILDKFSSPRTVYDEAHSLDRDDDKDLANNVPTQIWASARLDGQRERFSLFPPTSRVDTISGNRPDPNELAQRANDYKLSVEKQQAAYLVKRKQALEKSSP